ncbi:MAG: double zinc ribbon domain-containing protein [Odoribacter sp.]
MIWKQVYSFVKKGCCSLLSSLGDLLFPPVCLVCGRSLVRGERYLCTACVADFPFSDETYATGTKVLENFDENCRPESLYSLFYYSKYSRYKNLIYTIKYHSHKQLGIYLGRMLGEHIAGICRADCIVPIPLHPKRERERGFNQSYQIALGVSEVLGIEILDDVVFRVHNNISQTGKSVSDRLKNVENIFELRNSQKIRGRHILLLDDVITTGATIASCLRVLAQEEDVKFSLGCLAQTV